MKITILVYEDNENLRTSIVGLLERNEKFKVVGNFGHCQDVAGHVEYLKPDVVLMDIDLPGMNGIEGVRQIREIDKKVNVIMLTVFDDNTSVYDALYAGANGYLLKKHISERLSHSIIDVLEGGAAMSPAIARKILDNVMHKAVRQPLQDYQLTPRELEVLVSLGKGNSYKMVADDLGISIETVRSHIKKIYEKLHVQSQGEAISKALREGLIE